MTLVVGGAAKVVACLVVATSAAALTWVVTAPSSPGADASGSAWFDQPLHGSRFPEGASVAITAHVAHPGGVESVTLHVDGEPTASASGEGLVLATVEFDWTPEATGLHGLEVRASVGGDVEPTAEIAVAIGDGEESVLPTTPDEEPPPISDPESDPGQPEESLPPTTIPDRTPSTTTPGTSPPTTVPSPTTTAPCTPSAPTPTAPLNGSSPGGQPTVQWSASSCGVSGFRVEVRVAPTTPPTITSPLLSATIRSWAPPGGFPCVGRPLYWRVGAVTGGTTLWSPMWSFTC